MHLHRLMNKAIADAGNERQEFFVMKLLTLLGDKAMFAAAEKCLDDPCTFIIECNFVDQVWEDPRIQRRIQALAGQGIEVSPQDATAQIADHSYTRRQLLVAF